MGKTIYNRKRAKQLYQYDGLYYGKIHPTDIDGLLDFGDMVFVILEYKVAGNEMLQGQRLALERLTDNLHEANKEAICLVADHNTPIDEDIDGANSVVVTYRYHGKWHTPENNITVREAIDRMLQKHAPRFLEP